MDESGPATRRGQRLEWLLSGTKLRAPTFRFGLVAALGIHNPFTQGRSMIRLQA